MRSGPETTPQWGGGPPPGTCRTRRGARSSGGRSRTAPPPPAALTAGGGGRWIRREQTRHGGGRGLRRDPPGGSLRRHGRHGVATHDPDQGLPRAAGGPSETGPRERPTGEGTDEVAMGCGNVPLPRGDGGRRTLALQLPLRALEVLDEVVLPAELVVVPEVVAGGAPRRGGGRRDGGCHRGEGRPRGESKRTHSLKKKKHSTDGSRFTWECERRAPSSEAWFGDIGAF